MPIVLDESANVLELVCVQCGSDRCAAEREEAGKGICVGCIQSNLDAMLRAHHEERGNGVRNRK